MSALVHFDGVDTQDERKRIEEVLEGIERRANLPIPPTKEECPWVVFKETGEHQVYFFASRFRRQEWNVTADSIGELIDQVREVTSSEDASEASSEGDTD